MASATGATGSWRRSAEFGYLPPESSTTAASRIRSRAEHSSTRSRICLTRLWCSCWAVATAKPTGFPEIAGSLFGKTPLGWSRVQAICDYVHQHLAFGYEHARATRTAWEAYCDRTGVCRDYAHLAVALCRCMNIPARYCTGYLGDIGVPISDAPMDFSAWFEAYLEGRWYTFDARHNVPRIGRVLIACGRDAADVAISTTFGPNTLSDFTVGTEEVTAGRSN
jgi:transglutaminase-like putative cysteine protease